MRDLADLHLHSNVSDGLDSPAELVNRADELELGGVALTDHDILEGNRDFMSCDASASLQRIPGVEISTEHDGIEVHMLGYFVQYGPSSLKTRLGAIEKARRERFPRMMRKLGLLGIDVSEEEMREALEGVGSPGRPHLARILVDKGVVGSVQEAFDKYLADGKPAYVKKERVDTIEAIRLLRDMAAVPVLAHPLMIDAIGRSKLLAELKSYGLLGVETEYNYSHVETHWSAKSLRAAAKKLGLIQTGGSDYHGDPTHPQLGDVVVRIDVVKSLRRAHEGLRRP
jgi:predicted metal-dependent phosphoesterase TrpH